jgi:hypothetical protein
MAAAAIVGVGALLGAVLGRITGDDEPRAASR